MLPDPVSNPGPLTYESGALPIALRGPASRDRFRWLVNVMDRSGLDFVKVKRGIALSTHN